MTARSLTRTEQRIARLVAAGRSNPEIASELGVARKTVEWHVSRLLRKLGVRSREELAGAAPVGPAASPPVGGGAREVERPGPLPEPPPSASYGFRRESSRRGR
jgi:DNA-binding CsgD family transcriptional regulator